VIRKGRYTKEQIGEGEGTRGGARGGGEKPGTKKEVGTRRTQRLARLDSRGRGIKKVRKTNQSTRGKLTAT